MQNIDQVVAAGSVPAPGQALAGKSVLAGKSMYAFGDSIIYGHTYPLGFADFIAEQEGMLLSKHARNGAAIGPSGKQVITQVLEASSTCPDFVLLNGGTNDANQIHNLGAYQVGKISQGWDPDSFSADTYAGMFEQTLHTITARWPTAKVVYVAVHKLCSLDWDTQLAIREAALQGCEKWKVTVADIFGDTDFDARIDAHRREYSFNDLTDGLPGTDGSGTHPNLAAISRYYQPLVTDILIKLASGYS